MNTGALYTVFKFEYCIHMPSLEVDGLQLYCSMYGYCMERSMVS